MLQTRLPLIAMLASAIACSPAPPRADEIAAPADPGAGAAVTREATPASSMARLFVSNEASGDVSVIDVLARQVVQTIAVGKRPRGIRVSPDGRTVFVALSGSPAAPPGIDESTLPPADKRHDGIGVIDVAAGRLVRTLPGGSDPEQFAVSADGSRLFVSNEDAAALSVVDIAAGRVIQSIPVGEEPEGVDLSPDGRVVYVTSEDESTVTAVDTATLAPLARIAVGPRPRSTGFLPDGTRAIVSAENAHAVTLIDSRTHRLIRTITLSQPGWKPMGVVVPRSGEHVFVTTGRGGHLVLLDASTFAEVAAIRVGERPWGVAVTGDGRTAFTANGPSNDVTVVDVASRKVVARIPVGSGPWGVAVAEPVAAAK